MDQTLIDPEAWKMLKSMTDSSFLVDLIDLFLSDSPGLIRQIRDGLAAGDIDLVRRAAHSLKSNSASFGASSMADAARDLELLAKSGTLAGAETKLALVETEYARLAPILMEKRDEC